MLRRRRPLKGEAIHFSFDSFLDLVTNVVGIIIRLILAAWIGARSYHASMQFLDNQPESPTKATATTIVDDPLQHRIDLSKRDLDDAKTLLLARLKELEAGEQKTVSTEAELATLVKRREELGAELRSLESKGSQGDGKVRQASLSVDQVRQRSKKLLDDIKKLEETPSNMKQLKYHAPVSRAVRSDELFFECKNGRVTYIDLPSFLQEYKTSLEECAQELKTKWQVERRTAPVGPYRLRYVVERERTGLDAGETPAPGNFRYGLSAWEVEPITSDRGETLEQALRAKSEFRLLTDGLDSNLTVVTFWVYPDSFELFRGLRDHLYDRGLDIAGRPLPPGAPIAASKHGTASRGQ